jgi:hypothetical protein
VKDKTEDCLIVVNWPLVVFCIDCEHRMMYFEYLLLVTILLLFCYEDDAFFDISALSCSVILALSCSASERAGL